MSVFRRYYLKILLPVLMGNSQSLRGMYLQNTYYRVLEIECHPKNSLSAQLTK